MDIQKKESLWELAAQYFQALDESGGEMTPETEQLELAVSQKVDACRFVAEMLEDQEERWAEKKAYAASKEKALAASRKRLESNLMAIIMSAEKVELTGNESVAKLVRNPKRLTLNESELHPMMMMQVTETVPDKERIRHLLDTGHEVGGAKYEHGYRIAWKDLPGKTKEIT